MAEKAELVLDAQATLGEGSIWDADYQVLYWIDILENKLNVFDPATGKNRTIDVDQIIGTVVPRKSGGVMVAAHHGFGHIDLETEKLTIINDPEEHLPRNRFNDGKCDPAGRFWAGTISLDEEPKVCSLYCMDTDLSVRRMLTNVSNSNGIVWSPDKTKMYYIDTPTHEVAAFDYDLATGDISNRRVAARVPIEIGYPDGMTIDTEGRLWVAPWGAGRIICFNPDNGEIVDEVPVPAKQLTSCAFGGPDMRDLYITSAKYDAGMERGEDAGGLFRARPGVEGLPMPPFGG